MKPNMLQNASAKNICCKKRTMKEWQKLAQNINKNRLSQEIEILQVLKHPNIIKLHEIYQGENSYYLITNLLEGGTLYQYIKSYSSNNPIPHQKIKLIMKVIISFFNYFKQILDCILYLEKLGIIHRDIKLDNIMLSKQNDVNNLQIIDFGLAIYEDQKQKLALCGTPGYIAPEILRSENQKTEELFTYKVDVFSCGVIFYKLLTKKTLFRSQNTNEILEMNKACEIDFYDIDCKLVSKDALDLLKLMLHDNPDKRISAKEALEHKYFDNSIQTNGEKLGQTIEKQNQNNGFVENGQKEKLSDCWSLPDEYQAAPVPLLNAFSQTQFPYNDKFCMSSRNLKTLSKYQFDYMPSFQSIQYYKSDSLLNKEDSDKGTNIVLNLKMNRGLSARIIFRLIHHMISLMFYFQQFKYLIHP